ncbi:MAG: hypothetical protein BWY57_01480 [Betaproteobacteria bacterium ADurb.Bin341]|nr:MAG: hypothetical protein BWY57_01480 [Betaproteobacteria bacterium ADurb.Bin341]
MSNWTPRQVSGATFACVGICALLIQPALTKTLAGTSQFFAGLSQAGLAAIGLGGLVIGVYRLATKDN